MGMHAIHRAEHAITEAIIGYLRRAVKGQWPAGTKSLKPREIAPKQAHHKAVNAACQRWNGARVRARHCTSCPCLSVAGRPHCTVMACAAKGDGCYLEEKKIDTNCGRPPVGGKCGEPTKPSQGRPGGITGVDAGKIGDGAGCLRACLPCLMHIAQP
jgi:hypothetical protein